MLLDILRPVRLKSLNNSLRALLIGIFICYLIFWIPSIVILIPRFCNSASPPFILAFSFLDLGSVNFVDAYGVWNAFSRNFEYKLQDYMATENLVKTKKKIIRILMVSVGNILP